MIKYFDKNLEQNINFVILQKLGFFATDRIKKFWNKYKEWANIAERVVGDVNYNNNFGEINVICIRNNKEVSFNIGKEYYNDILLIIKNRMKENDDDEIYIYKVTADPKGIKNNIAHLLEGIYDSYKIRNHRWIPGRIAICQDRNVVIVARTDKQGQVKKTESGFFGINIHDSSIYKNSSIGCTVLEPDSKENNYHFEMSFKPLLKECKKQKRIVYLVANFITIQKFLFAEYLDDYDIIKDFYGFAFSVYFKNKKIEFPVRSRNVNYFNN